MLPQIFALSSGPVSADDPLPNEHQKQALCELMARAFIEIRMLAREHGIEQIESIADAFHNLPREICGWGSWSVDIARGMLADHQARHGGNWVEAFDQAMDKK